MDWIAFAVQWLHVLLGIFWFGTTLTMDFIVIPAVNRLPVVVQREIASHIGSRASPIFRVVVPAIVVLGIIRGTLYGPIDSVDAVFGTTYGLTWLAALALTIGLCVWGLRVLEPAIHAMQVAPLHSDGLASAEVEAATNRVKRLVGLELVGFLLIFSCMVLMRFGL
jgi:uncharacterized membrane protein